MRAGSVAAGALGAAGAVSPGLDCGMGAVGRVATGGPARGCDEDSRALCSGGGAGGVCGCDGAVCGCVLYVHPDAGFAGAAGCDYRDRHGICCCARPAVAELVAVARGSGSFVSNHSTDCGCCITPSATGTLVAGGLAVGGVPAGAAFELVAFRESGPCQDFYDSRRFAGT